jgi:pyrimidine operon attenuation protein/uracil phosphoribosyltransferase
VSAKKEKMAQSVKKTARVGARAGKPTTAGSPTRLFDAVWLKARVDDFAKEIAFSGALDDALIVGVQRCGVVLARRVRERVRELTGVNLPLGELDVTLYRDDALWSGAIRKAGRGTTLPMSPDRRIVHLFDDVLYTGRTTRAALDQLMDFGRPARVRYYVLVDRGGRELPIQADRVGVRVTAGALDRIVVRLKESGGEDGVYIEPEESR